MVPATAAEIANTPSGERASTKRVTPTTACSSARRLASRGALPGTPISARPTAVLNSTSRRHDRVGHRVEGVGRHEQLAQAKPCVGSISVSL